MIELKSIYSGGDLEDSDGMYEGFLILLDGESIGEVCVKTWDDGSCLIERIDIDEAFRGHGYGSEVIRSISEEHGGAYIVPDSERSQSLYDRLGCSVSTEPWSYLDAGYGVYRV